MALPTKLRLEIVTPERLLVSEEVDEVELPGAEGYFGVLPAHTPVLATLQVGELWYRIGQEKHYLAVAFGFAEVLSDRVTVLAQIAERPEDIDVPRPAMDMDFERARIALMKSLIRLQVASQARTRV